jgi:hypothetical protein
MQASCGGKRAYGCAKHATECFWAQLEVIWRVGGAHLRDPQYTRFSAALRGTWVLGPVDRMWGLGRAWEANASKLRRKTGLRVCKTCNRMLLGPIRGHLEGWRGPSSGSPVYEIFSRPERDLGPRTSRLKVRPRPCLGGQCKQVAAENGPTGVQNMQPNAFGPN